MPASVKRAIGIAAQKYGGKTEDEARDFIAKMEREGRLIEECWN
jgi:sulfite reductase alpha subunit-like flavoprotein